jgi:hypothetical protein
VNKDITFLTCRVEYHFYRHSNEELTRLLELHVWWKLRQTYYCDNLLYATASRHCIQKNELMGDCQLQGSQQLVS